MGAYELAQAAKETHVSDFVKVENVFVNQSIQSREEALRFICEKGAELGVVTDVEAAYDAFVAREEMGETGMTDGFAVPHAKSAAISEAAVIVIKNDHPLEWPSFDDKPVDVMIALLVPDSEAGTTHIRLLSKTAVLLMRDEFKNLVRGTDDPQAIADAVNAGIAEE
nr:fructose PTS transporter subunit IIA [Olsenella profusa]